MDFITNLPRTKNGNYTILAIVDRFSKYIVLVPCKHSVNAADVAKIFFDNVVCRFGMPQKIISDRDVRF